MISPVKSLAKVMVVDPNPNDYSSLAHGTPFADVEFQFHRDGRSVLRDDMSTRPELCVINMNLPDMSGLDLYEMLSQRWPNVTVFLVGDDYRPEDEVLARSSGATFYFCKPLPSEWLEAAAAGTVGCC